MHKRYLFAFIVSIFFISLLSLPALAISQNVMISQVQVGNSSNSRLIELYNTSENPVDITGWCLYHSSASEKTKDQLLCFDGDNAKAHLILSGLSYILIGSSELGVDADFNLDSSLGTATGGHIYILDKDQEEIDRIGWGTAVSPETTAFSFDPTNLGHVIERKMSLLGTYIDTDDNSLDFINSSLRATYLTGAISEVDDICSNIDGIQPLMPDSYYRDEEGLCQPELVDVCLNIDGLQTEAPLGFYIDGGGNCTRMDLCLNFGGIQKSVPSGFITLEDSCVIDGLPLQINEIMPNISGSDNGHEFIEIYNPNDVAVDLDYYILFTGINQDKSYSLPLGSIIDAKSYAVFYNNQISFTLSNTSSAVGLRLTDDTKLGVTDTYTAPQDDMAWALISGTWQYTNRPTPGKENLESVVTVTPKLQPVAIQTSLKPCLVSQYRSPETNRCRNYPTESILVACAQNEYRNPDTNRCRSVLGASTSSLTPCDNGKIRNSETNRCRTVVQMASVPYPVQTSEDNSSEGYMGWWIAGGLVVMAITYAIWEWRNEITRFINWFVTQAGSRGQG